MPEISSDDGPRKLRAVWLGPRGGTLPFEWSYTQWALTLAAIPGGVSVVDAVLSLLRALLGFDLWTVTVFAVVFGPAIGVWAAVAAMRGVSFDAPLRYRIATLRAELRRRPALLSESASVEILVPIVQDPQVPLADHLGWLSHRSLPAGGGVR